MIKTILAESNGSAGAETIADTSIQRGMALSRYRAGRLMKACQLTSCKRPKYAYPKAKQKHIAMPNHLNRGCDVNVSDQVWCGNVIYIWVVKRWTYLAVVMDFICT